MNILSTIGNTPLIELDRLETSAVLLAKVELFNPGGSIKDRVALSMIEEAEKEGRLHEGSVIIEPTSGNTGIGLALVASIKGYRTIIVMPSSMSEERRQTIRAYGAELELTPAETGMAGSIEKANELAASIPGSFIPSQFDNPANVLAHYRTTGPEIWEQSGHKVDVLVSGVGTGGTLTGAGRYLRSCNPGLKIIAVEPAASAVLSGMSKGKHNLQGIGAGFIPAILDLSLIDDIVKVKEEDAYETGRLLCQRQGIFAGISSGAAVWAALSISKAYEGKRIAVILPDSGSRYLSTPLFK